MLNWKENWEKLRRFIDNEEEDQIPALIKHAEQNKSESELFLQKLLNAVESILKSEITRIPNTNKAYIPEKFIIFLSAEAERNLREDKRKFFEQGLSTIIFERAKEMADTLGLTSKKITVQISQNGTLEGDEIEVRAISEDSQKTVDRISQEFDVEFTENQKIIKNQNTIEDNSTIEDFAASFGILYRVEVWQSGKKLNEFPIILRKNTIGRDDQEKVANIRLPTENLKISRLHAEISLEDNGEVWVRACHKNPTIVSGKVIRNGEKAKLEPSGEIQIYDFTLKLKFS